MARRLYETEREWVKVDEIVAELKEFVVHSVGGELYDVEKGILERVIALGRRAVQAFVIESGTGYTPGCPPMTEDGRALEYKGIETVGYLSVFGAVSVPRAAYAHPDGGRVYPMEAQWNCPDPKYSYLLQEKLQGRTADGDMRAAAADLNDIFGLELAANVPERLTQTMGPYVQSFYEQAPAPDPETEGTHIGVTADGKGVRIVRRDREGSVRAEPKARLGKGDKRGIKKESIVTAHFTFTPESRDPETVMRMLMKQLSEKERQDRRKDRRRRREQGLPLPREPINVHARAALQDSEKEKAFARLIREVQQRDPGGDKEIVAFFDGNAGLKLSLLRELEKVDLRDRLDAVVLDIWHVAEYVWTAGTALYGEGTSDREAWVAQKLLALLEGRVGRVIGALRQILTKHKRRLRAAQKEALNKAITYFENHRDMMDYGAYLDKGYPIATGLVEGLCNSLVKDRMEQSGMRWSIEGAQHMLDMRAVQRNGDWSAFCAYQRQREHERLYAGAFKIAA